jgi:hypothetical protein
MLILFPTHRGDIRALQNLLRWILQLGPLKNHDALICADAATPMNEAEQAHIIAKEIFREVRVITNPQPVSGWKEGSWSLFQAATEYIEKEWPQPFLLMETDAIPLKSHWLGEIDVHYKIYWSESRVENNSPPFMGHIYDSLSPVGTFMSGIAVYPPNTFSRFPKSEQPVHWDVHGAQLMVSQGVHTNLIYHVFDGPNHRPVSEWWEKPDMLVDGRPLVIPPECVLFHRDKGQTLIPLLKRKLFPGSPTKPPIRVVFPVHNGDITLAVRHAQWLVKLSAGEKWNHPATISHDPSCNVILLNQLQALLNQCFEQVDVFVYPRPPLPLYPAAANHAWQRTAIQMSRQDAPWFWLEADGVVLKKSWLDELQAEYEAGGKLFMGPHVQGMAHSNGVMVYPPEAPEIMRTAMSLTDRGAFDYSGAHEYMPQCHSGRRLIQHVWTILNGEPCEVGGGASPDDMTPEQARRWIRPEAVFYHRLKSNALVEHLISGRYSHPS